MHIPVIYNDNTQDAVPDVMLGQLLSSRSIKLFYRYSEGWVTVEVGLLRGRGGTYDGPERRTAVVSDGSGLVQGELWRSGRLLRKVYEESPVGIGLCDFQGRLIDANRACLELFGLQGMEETGAFNLFVDPRIPEDAKDRLHEAGTVRYETSIDFEELKQSGIYSTSRTGVAYADVLITPVAANGDNAARVFLVMVQDITAQKEARRKVLEIKKGESLVELAGWFVREFNTLLQVILGNVSLARDSGQFDIKVGILLERAESASLSACSLTERLAGICGDGVSAETTTPEDEPEKFSPGVIRPDTGKVLVMEDTESIRRVCGAFLMRIGYEVEFAENGEEALSRCREAAEQGRPFDVVILDLTVAGGLGVRETIVRMSEAAPDIKAIVSSGYRDDPVMTGFYRYGFRGAISKPYTLQGLADTVRAVKYGSDHLT